MKVLVVEDERKTAAYLKRGLEENGFVADVADNGEDGAHLAQTRLYDLIILDVLLPGRDGWSIVADLRRREIATPVLFLTARDAVGDRVKGLELGADDYLVKPFAFSELMARIRSILRRGPARQSPVLKVADLELDLHRHRATGPRARLPFSNPSVSAASGAPATVAGPIRRGSMRRRRCLAILVVLAAVSPARAADAPSVPVGTANVVFAAVPRDVRALGEVDSLGKTTLSAPVTGEIVGPFQTAGEVAAGTVIARNVPPTMQSSIARARADVAIAQAAYARTKQLVTQRLSTQLALGEARGNVVRAEEQLNGLRREAAQQVMTAPFAGTLHYLISPGTVVYKGTPIATISGRATPWIDVRVPPEAVRKIRVGTAARIAASSWSGSGRVMSVGHDARTLGLVRVRIGLPDGNPLVPGEWAWVRLSRPGPPAAAVPESAVVMRGGRTMVFILQGGKAHAVPVRVLAEQGGRAWLAGPLRSGERVAVTHAARLADGSRVSIRSDPSPGPSR